jgi:hypothetical protein
VGVYVEGRLSHSRVWLIGVAKLYGDAITLMCVCGGGARRGGVGLGGGGGATTPLVS